MRTRPLSLSLSISKKSSLCEHIFDSHDTNKSGLYIPSPSQLYGTDLPLWQACGRHPESLRNSLWIHTNVSSQPLVTQDREVGDESSKASFGFRQMSESHMQCWTRTSCGSMRLGQTSLSVNLGKAMTTLSRSRSRKPRISFPGQYAKPGCTHSKARTGTTTLLDNKT